MSNLEIDSSSNNSGPDQSDQFQGMAKSQKEFKKLAKKEVIVTEESASTFDFLLDINISSVDPIQVFGQPSRFIVEHSILEHASKMATKCESCHE